MDMKTDGIFCFELLWLFMERSLEKNYLLRASAFFAFCHKPGNKVSCKIYKEFLISKSDKKIPSKYIGNFRYVYRTKTFPKYIGQNPP